MADKLFYLIVIGWWDDNVQWTGTISTPRETSRHERDVPHSEGHSQRQTKPTPWYTKTGRYLHMYVSDAASLIALEILSCNIYHCIIPWKIHYSNILQSQTLINGAYTWCILCAQTFLKQVYNFPCKMACCGTWVMKLICKYCALYSNKQSQNPSLRHCR